MDPDYRVLLERLVLAITDVHDYLHRDDAEAQGHQTAFGKAFNEACAALGLERLQIVEITE